MTLQQVDELQVRSETETVPEILVFPPTILDVLKAVKQEVSGIPATKTPGFEPATERERALSRLMGMYYASIDRDPASMTFAEDVVGGNKDNYPSKEIWLLLRFVRTIGVEKILSNGEFPQHEVPSQTHLFPRSQYRTPEEI